MADVRKRAACDRCHAQKTKCPRQPGQAICNRCLKAKANCVYSPFRQKKFQLEEPASGEHATIFRNISREEGFEAECSSAVVRAKRKRLTIGPETRSQVQDSGNSDSNFALDGGPLDYDWLSQICPLSTLPMPDINDISFESHGQFMSFDFDTALPGDNVNSDEGTANALNLNVGDLPNMNHSHSFESTAGILADGEDGSSISDTPDRAYSLWPEPPPIDSNTLRLCVKKLSQLSVDLYEHIQTIPPQSVHDPLSPENMGRWVAKQGKQYFAIEDTFRLTQAMIEVYPSFLGALASQKDRSNISSSGMKIDTSTVLLIFSCHLRLISVYDDLFKHMDACFAQSGKAITIQQHMLQGPQLRIGSYVPPNSTGIPMQMLLLIQFATQLFRYASDLAAELREPATTPSSDSSSPASTSSSNPEDITLAFARAAAENLKDRAGQMSGQIDIIKTRMIAMGML